MRQGSNIMGGFSYRARCNQHANAVGAVLSERLCQLGGTCWTIISPWAWVWAWAGGGTQARAGAGAFPEQLDVVKAGVRSQVWK